MQDDGILKLRADVGFSYLLVVYSYRVPPIPTDPAPETIDEASKNIRELKESRLETCLTLTPGGHGAGRGGTQPSGAAGRSENTRLNTG